MQVSTNSFETLLMVWIGVGLLTFLFLLKIKAPYGRHRQNGWGPEIPARIGWVVMESPCIIAFPIMFGTAASQWSEPHWPAIVFFLMWMYHYTHRTLVWPVRARISEKMMPISIMLTGVAFNGVNAWINAQWLFFIQHPYELSWLFGIPFIVGFILFVIGTTINITSDNKLFALREDGSTNYKIPRGGLFERVSCPNYFGEILEWLGWAIATWSPAGLAFFVWTVANLTPRAIAHHKWYKDEFEDYPDERKALIPFLV